MEKNQVSLTINGQTYYGWLSASISLNLQSFSRSFSVSLTEKANEFSQDKIPIKAGDAVVVSIGGDIVLTGYVVKVSDEYSASSRSITVTGDSKTIDLVDCCVPDGKELSFKNQTPIEIIRSLCRHYSIGVSAEVVKTDKINFDIAPEETIKNGLEKLLKANNLLLTDNASGSLVLSQVGSGGNCTTPIVRGVNVLKAKKDVDSSKLFSRYVLLGQGSNALSERPIEDLQLKQIASGDGVRYRVKTTIQTGNAVAAQMQARVALIRDVSKAQSETLVYTVQGWRQSDKKLWPINSYVMVSDSAFGINGRYLIEVVKYSLDSKGMTTELQLRRPEAFFNTEIASAVEAVKGLVLNKIGDVGSAAWTDK